MLLTREATSTEPFFVNLKITDGQYYEARRVLYDFSNPHSWPEEQEFTKISCTRKGQVLFTDVYQSSKLYTEKENMPPLSAGNLSNGDIIAVEARLRHIPAQGDLYSSQYHLVRIGLIEKATTE
ncbi:hypothetical protein NM688_g120 [Phlebia brevispora]|uniref:Uncharacterized protein n=1 Tax=Phlebia brevispora TaxID=194682 RepID=A0ACC1TEY5_9APHY|nr:hypothetical protein NM688_g120 [Phlebia brevispora]